MKRLSFCYSMRISMDAPVSDHHFVLRCLPDSDERQGVSISRVQIAPNDFLSGSRDQWGNRLIYGSCHASHTRFEAEICGTAQTGLSDSTPEGNPNQAMLFRYASQQTKAEGALKEFAEECVLTRSDALGQALCVMEAVHGRLCYRAGMTTVETTAVQAFDMGCGVCQDYSHVMLAVLRAQGISARYAVGMLMGEGKSHAWVEVLHRGRWYGFDPTNNTTVSDQHIKLSHGRDYPDCRINRGIFRGITRQQTEVTVTVTEAE